MNCRELIKKIVEQENMDAELVVRIVTRHPQTAVAVSHVDVPISFVWSSEPVIAIDQSDVDSAERQ